MFIHNSNSKECVIPIEYCDKLKDLRAELGDHDMCSYTMMDILDEVIKNIKTETKEGEEDNEN